MKEDDSVDSGDSKLENKGGNNVIEGEVTSKKHDNV